MNFSQFPPRLKNYKLFKETEVFLQITRNYRLFEKEKISFQDDACK